MSLRIDTSTSGGRRVVALTGPVDVSTASEAWETLEGTWDADLVLDLSGVDFLDSSGVNLLVRARKTGLTQGRAVTLRAPARTVVEVLAAIGLSDSFPLEPAAP